MHDDTVVFIAFRNPHPQVIQGRILSKPFQAFALKAAVKRVRGPLNIVFLAIIQVVVNIQEVDQISVLVVEGAEFVATVFEALAL